MASHTSFVPDSTLDLPYYSCTTMHYPRIPTPTGCIDLRVCSYVTHPALHAPKGDFDFRHLPLQDADCDKYLPLFRVFYFLGATVSFVNLFFAVYTFWKARQKNDRKRTQSVLLVLMCIYGIVLWGFRGIYPERSIGVDPAITIMFSSYLFLLYFTFAFFFGTSKFRGNIHGVLGFSLHCVQCVGNL